MYAQFIYLFRLTIERSTYLIVIPDISGPLVEIVDIIFPSADKILISPDPPVALLSKLNSDTNDIIFSNLATISTKKIAAIYNIYLLFHSDQRISSHLSLAPSN